MNNKEHIVMVVLWTIMTLLASMIMAGAFVGIAALIFGLLHL